MWNSRGGRTILNERGILSAPDTVVVPVVVSIPETETRGADDGVLEDRDEFSLETGVIEHWSATQHTDGHKL